MKPTTSPVKARAHTNIALVKYWGKKDEQLIIPQNSSLSLTLDQFYTDTAVQFRDELAADQITFNGQLLTDDGQRKISRFLNVVRDLAGISMHASVDTVCLFYTYPSPRARQKSRIPSSACQKTI